MITQLEGPLRRGLTIDGAAYVLTITPSGFQLTPKGRRKGFEMDWLAFVSGDAALATALNASVAQGRPQGRSKRASSPPPDDPAPGPSAPGNHRPRGSENTRRKR